jgi:ABC-type transporter Mla MlaB component
MIIEVHETGSYKVLNIRDNLDINSDFSELKKVIDDYVQKGTRDFALRFSSSSILHTKSVSVLISCVELIKENQGNIAIIDANESIMDLLRLIDIGDSMIRLCASEHELDKVDPADPL